MQELAIILSSLAGVATAAAVRKIPRNKPQLLSMGASSQIKSQINSLKIEKDLLAKTISRLYQDDAYSKISRDKLLLKYQHQMGVVLSKLEKLEQSSKHPDLGPVGDGLITLMDQKLSKLDDRLYELSSKMALATVTPADKDMKKPEGRVKASAKSTFDFKDKVASSQSPAKPRQSFELTTLTSLSRKPQLQPKEHTESAILDSTKPKNKKETTQTILESNLPVSKTVKPKNKKEMTPAKKLVLAEKPDISKEVAKFNKFKALPEPDKTDVVISDEDPEDDADDIDKIKGDIKKVLSKLDQAEVE